MNILNLYQSRDCKDYRCIEYYPNKVCHDGTLCAIDIGLRCRYPHSFKLGGCDSCSHYRCDNRQEGNPKLLSLIRALAV